MAVHLHTHPPLKLVLVSFAVPGGFRLKRLSCKMQSQDGFRLELHVGFRFLLCSFPYTMQPQEGSGLRELQVAFASWIALDLLF